MLASDKLNFSKYIGPVVTYQGYNLVTFERETEIVIFPGVYLLVIPTPGHSQDCVTYQLGNHLFTGDSYIPGVPVVTKLRGGDRILAKQSTEHIQSLLTENMIACPGHWGKSKLPF